MLYFMLSILIIDSFVQFWKSKTMLNKCIWLVFLLFFSCWMGYYTHMFSGNSFIDMKPGFLYA